MRKLAAAYARALFLPILPVIWGIFSVVGVVGGPFGTHHLTPTARAIYWPLVIGLGILGGALARVLVRDYLGQRRFRTEAPLIAAFSSVVLTPPFFWAALVLVPPGQHVPDFFEIFFYVVVVSFVVSSLRHLLGQHAAPLAPADAPPDLAPDPDPAPSGFSEVPQVRLMTRLEPALCAPLIRLQMNDHYVEVVTEKGMGRVLMRLADAIAETEGVEGLQVHRSHWVARDGVAMVLRDRGRISLAMVDGVVVPVSRAKAEEVLALGLPEGTAAPKAPAAKPPTEHLREAAQ